MPPSAVSMPPERTSTNGQHHKSETKPDRKQLDYFVGAAKMVRKKSHSFERLFRHCANFKVLRLVVSPTVHPWHGRTDLDNHAAFSGIPLSGWQSDGLRAMIGRLLLS